MSVFKGGIENLSLDRKTELLAERQKKTDLVINYLQKEKLDNLISQLNNGEGVEDVINGAYGKKIINPKQYLDLIGLTMKPIKTVEPTETPVLSDNPPEQKTEPEITPPSPLLQQEGEPEISIPNEDSIPESGMLGPDNHPVEDMSELINREPAKDIRESVVKISPEISPEPTEIAPEIKTESIPVTEPVTTPPPIPESVPVVQTEKTPIEEWEEFKKIRSDLAKAEAQKNNFSVDTGISIEELKTKYGSGKEKIAGFLRESEHQRLGFGEGPLTQEQESELNDYVFEELVVKENDEYLNALRANRKETWRDKAKEMAKSALSSAAFKWYLSQNKFVRIGLTTLLATGIGYGVGTIAATGAVGYAGARIARGVLSLEGAAMGRLVGSKIKRWDIENVNEWEKRKEEEIKNSSDSLEEKSMELRKIKEKADKERRKRALKKAALTISFGAGAGLLAGTLEHFGGSGGASRALEHANRPRTGTPDQFKGENLQQFLNRRGTANFGPKPNLDDLGKTAEKSFNPSLQPIKPIEQTEILEPEPVATESVPVKIIFEHPENLEHIKVEEGDSFWKVVGKGLEENEKFKNLTGGQKEYAIKHFINKGISDPERYGLPSDEKFGVQVEIGKEMNLRNLFGDEDEVGDVLSKASKENFLGGTSVLNDRITTWVAEHPGQPPTPASVPEILATEPRVEVALAEPGEETLVPEALPPETHSEILESGEIKNNLEPTELLKPKVALQQELENDIAGYKQQLQALEEGRKIEGNNAGLRTMAGDVSVGQVVEEAFKADIDHIYGHKGVLGMGRVAGVDTEDWKLMAGLKANKVIEYFRNPESMDLQKDLPAKVLTELKTSEKHRWLVEQITGLMDKAHQKSGVDFAPYNSESMESFIKRLGAFLMKSK